MKKLFSIVFALCMVTALSACMATRESSIKKMDSYIGKTEKDVIAGWGVPDKTYKMDDGTDVIAYREEREQYDPPTSTVCMGTYPGAFGYSVCGGGGSTRRVKRTCEYSFYLQRGVVVKWDQHGNNCPASD